MSVISRLIDLYKRKAAQSCELDDYISELTSAIDNTDAIIYANTFFDLESSEACQMRNNAVLAEMDDIEVNKIKPAHKRASLIQKRTDLSSRTAELEKRIEDVKIQTVFDAIGNIEGNRLDRQQMLCIACDTHNHLVVAGAGTGKTTTIVGKVKYLLKTGRCTPNDLLVLSFTNASAKQMRERIHNETGEKIEVSTFHKLGLNIITEVCGAKQNITQLDLSSYAKEKVKECMRNEQYRRILCEYFVSSKIRMKSEFEFTSEKEYKEYLRTNQPITIKGEIVKSYGEMNIANALAQNGVEYEYDKAYEFGTHTSKRREYRPSFFLPEYNIYIEYFVIDENGDVPEYFSGRSKRSAKEVYADSMSWKRAVHKINGAMMIECYAYEQCDGDLTEKLIQKLSSNSVSLRPINANQLCSYLNEDIDYVVGGIAELMTTAINLMRSNSYSISDVQRKCESHADAINIKLFLKLLEPIYSGYLAYLRINNEIDFSDMIITATKHVSEGKYACPYKYVIVDEYQDISKARFMLLYELRKTRDYDLFCVGDDWQSIYRFAGSEVCFLTHFEKYWGDSVMSKIETTYRFSQKLIEISGSFIMKNPYQIKKSMIGNKSFAGYAMGEICGFTELWAMRFVTQRLDDLEKDSTVFFIGRYTYDVVLLKSVFELEYDKSTGITNVIYAKRPDLSMQFITAHKSKGLQADYVFIINNKDARMGFPSKIQNAAIIDLLLTESEPFPHAEERRLFYVAMTRAKRKVFFVTMNDNKSEFICELIDEYYSELNKERFTCPRCGGKIIKQASIFGDGYICSNYKTNGCTYKRE